MNGVGLFGAMAIGLIAGWLAARVFGYRHDAWTSLAAGVAGSMLVDLLLSVFGVWAPPGLLSHLAAAAAGALVMLGIFRGFRRTP